MSYYYGFCLSGTCMCVYFKLLVIMSIHCYCISEFNIPDICFSPVDRGDCDGFERRYVYIPRTGRCQAFRYSGCGGNKNNFVHKRHCIKMCMKGVFPAAFVYFGGFNIIITVQFSVNNDDDACSKIQSKNKNLASIRVDHKKSKARFMCIVDSLCSMFLFQITSGESKYG